jgi:hypothetical protein
MMTLRGGKHQSLIKDFTTERSLIKDFGRLDTRTVLNVDKVSSSKCHTRHFATGGVAQFNYVLVTNSNPVMTCASDG